MHILRNDKDYFVRKGDTNSMIELNYLIGNLNAIDAILGYPMAV